jgi:methylated-DNA-protein-cysteine methyltransferase-like protein
VTSVASSVSAYPRIYALVSRIPRGRVATYGQIARLAGVPGQARLVGYALAVLRDGNPVPWHRVVNAKGQVSARSDGSPMDRLQRLRLERERVRFDDRDCISLSRFRWRPRPRGAQARAGAGRGVNREPRNSVVNSARVHG